MMNMPKFKSNHECKNWCNKHNSKPINPRSTIGMRTIKQDVFRNRIKHNYETHGNEYYVFFVSDLVEECYKLLDELNITVEIKHLYDGPYFNHDDNDIKRCVYSFTIKGKYGSYTSKYGNSIDAYEKKRFPTCYDIIACVTKCDPGSLDEFCGDFGYDTDSIKANTVYSEVIKEYRGMVRALGVDVLEKIQEIS